MRAQSVCPNPHSFETAPVLDERVVLDDLVQLLDHVFECGHEPPLAAAYYVAAFSHSIE